MFLNVIIYFFQFTGFYVEFFKKLFCVLWVVSVQNLLKKLKTNFGLYVRN